MRVREVAWLLDAERLALRARSLEEVITHAPHPQDPNLLQIQSARADAAAIVKEIDALLDPEEADPDER
jgi:hypothetical protein